ncbi:MAG: NAD(P)-dependent oxidoreductase, partial [Pseudomonadota bacterium]
MMNHYALFANLQDRPCLVVGAGEVGARKARQLVESGAAVTIVALEVGSEASDMASRGELKVEQRAFEDTDVDGAMLVIAATSDDALNQRIFD